MKSTYLPLGDCTVNVLMILESMSFEYGQIVTFFFLCKHFAGIFRNLMSESEYIRAQTPSTASCMLSRFNTFGRVSQKNKLNLWRDKSTNVMIKFYKSPPTEQISSLSNWLVDYLMTVHQLHRLMWEWLCATDSKVVMVISMQNVVFTWKVWNKLQWE